MSLDARVVDGDSGQSHALVIGASLAGLTAARALAYSVDRVTVIERDWVPRGPARRRGVPQARHTHSLTAAALHGLEELFPGIGRDLTAAGAVRVRLPGDILLLGPGGWLPRFDSDMSMLSASRDLIDAVIRERLRAERKVTFLQEHEVIALEPGRNDTVTGVWVRRKDRKAPGGWAARHLISADFVVDASGRGSRAPRWLAELGYETPGETVTDARTSCATALFAPPIGHVADWKSLLLMAAPGNPRQGVLNPVEGGRWSVSVASSGGEAPPPTTRSCCAPRASCATRCSARSSAPPHRSARSTAAAPSRTAGGTTRACAAGPTSSSSSATPSPCWTRPTARE